MKRRVGGVTAAGLAALWRISEVAARPAVPGPAGWAVVVTKEMLATLPDT